MLTWLIRNRLAAFERKYSYDTSYVRDILAADRRAFVAFAKMSAALRAYRRDAPRDALWAAGLVGSIAEDCGPCTQLGVTMALEDGASARTLAAVLAGRDAELPEDAHLAVGFARAVIAHDPGAELLREEIQRRWGPRALVSLAFAIAGARLYPTIKYALGHGKACQRVTIEGEPVAVARSAA
jgi:alkylhydroperoxidase family enzyme